MPRLSGSARALAAFVRLSIAPLLVFLAGSVGPAQAAGVQAAPSAAVSRTLTTRFNYTGGIQEFTLPTSATSLTIHAIGGKGGEQPIFTTAGGDGADIRADYSEYLSQLRGKKLSVLVGGAGLGPPKFSYFEAAGAGGGGGGSFVWAASGFGQSAPFDDVLIAAGGGGGGARVGYCSWNGTGQDAITSSTTGTAGTGPSGVGSGGSGRGGGAGGDTSGGAGGGGVTGNGGDATQAGGVPVAYARGGRSLLNGGAGGEGALNENNGGFGGGGGGETGGGGGGGYSGGGGGSACGAGGGGSSFTATSVGRVSGTYDSPDYETGDGFVEFIYDTPVTPVSIAMSPNPAVEGQTVTLTATVGGTNPTGTVTFSADAQNDAVINFVNLGSASVDASGKATLTVSNLSFTTYAIQTTYSGDANNPPGDLTPHDLGVLVVDPPTPVISVTSSPNPSVVGQPVTFTVTFSGYDPDGNVLLCDTGDRSGTCLTSGKLDSTGRVTSAHVSFTVSSLGAGSHIILADDQYNAAHATTTHVVKLASSISLTSSPNPSELGQLVTLTAHVTGSNPTGSVTFLDTYSPSAGSYVNAVLGIVALSGGVAALTTDLPPAYDGIHRLGSDYSGDATNGPNSIAFTLSQIVHPDTAPPIVSARVDPAAGPSGWHTIRPTLSLSATDATGVTSWSVDGVSGLFVPGYPAPAKTTPPFDFTIDDEGVANVTYSATDALGYTSTPQTLTVRVDTVKPTTTASLQGTQGADGSYTSPVTFSFNATDATSGIAMTQFAFRYQAPDGTVVAGPDPAPFTGPFRGAINPGQYWLTFRSVDAAGNVEDAQTVSFTRTNPVPALSIVNPNTITAGSADVELTLTGSGFVAPSQVLWNGTPLATLYWGLVDGVETLTATVPAANLASVHTPEGVAIAVFNPAPGGGTSQPRALTIVDSTTVGAQSAVAAGGGTASVDLAPTTAGSAGLSATLTNRGAGDAIVTAATYSSVPTGTTTLAAGTSYLDLRVSGADPGDSLAARVYYSSSVTGDEEAGLSLQYWDGAAWQQVRGSGGAVPQKDTTGNLDGTLSGGRFSFTLDSSSTPPLSQLEGTQLALAPDRAPPTVTAATSPAAPNGANGWFTTAPTLSFSAADEAGGSGVREIEYTVDGAQPVVVQGAAASALLAADGIHAVTYRARDKVGNTSPIQSLTVKVDTTAPTVTYTGNAGTYSVDQTVAITCTPDDNGSGLDSVDCLNVAGPAYRFLVSPDGPNAYSATAIDKAGNVGKASVTFTVAADRGGLCRLVNHLVQSKGIANSLCVKLSAGGPGSLDAFRNEVRAQTGKVIPTADSGALIALVDHL